MGRYAFGCVIAVLLGTHSGFAQTSLVAARTIQSSVLVQEPRGDSNVVMTVPPGVVVQLFAQTGDWYQARTIGSVARTGWIHRTVIELLPADAGAALLPNGTAVASQPSQSPPETSSPLPEPDFSAGHRELVVEGGMAGWNSAGETIGVFQLDGLVGFVASQHFEIVVSTSILKASGVDAFGTFGGGLLANFRENGPIVPFVGGVIGRGFGASSLFAGLVDDPTFVNASGGFRILTRGGGGALIVRPFYERYFNSSDIVPVADVNRFGISLGASILF
jgi:SH3 domain-containing protein